MNLHGASTVFCFELKRTLTYPRMAGWGLLAFFPAGITSLMVHQGVHMRNQESWGLVLFALIVEVICLLGLLLWATPLVHSELEGRTWIYLAVRPHGRTSVLFGKYLIAVGWTVSAAWTSTTAAVLIARPTDGFRLWVVLLALVFFSCITYGALFSLFSVIFQRRAMVVAVAYSLLFEFLVSFIPAVINQVTVSFRLRNLLVTWMDWQHMDPDLQFFLSDMAWYWHVLVLLFLTAGLLTAAAIVIQKREYITGDEI